MNGANGCIAAAPQLNERLESYIRAVPKAELHVHIEGTFEPELAFQLAARNNIQLHGTPQSLRERRETFKDLQDFLDMYYEACKVLLTEQDFYDLMYAYLRRAAIDAVFVAEIFFDPQTHTERGVPFDVVINGLHRALTDGYLDFGIKGSLVMCFLRHLSEEAAVETLEQATPHLDKIVGVGLDSGEVGNPPSKFERVFKMAAGLGLKLVAHAGEEAGPDYVKQALDLLHVRRVDHGVRSLEDEALVRRLVEERVPLTTCPLSNKKLQVISRFFGGRASLMKEMLERGLMVTVNSDDPAYFGGYINDNFLAIAKEAGLSEREVCQICRNSFDATFLPEAEKRWFQRKIDLFNVTMGYAAPAKSVSIFGSRSPTPGSEKYDGCFRVAREFAARGFRVVNGGYNGIMAAASQGAAEGAKVFASNSPLGAAQQVDVEGVLVPRVFSSRNPTGNAYITRSVMTYSLNERLGRLLDASEYMFVCGGTIGTLTELMLVWNEASIRPLHGGIPKRIYALKSAWQDVLTQLAESIGMHLEDRGLVTFVESGEEVVDLVEADWKARKAQATL